MAKPEVEILWESDPEWLTTFGDLITLLMTFFVLLISFSSIDTGKLEQTIENLQSKAGILDKANEGGSLEGFSTAEITNSSELDSLLDSGQSNKAVLDYKEELYKEVNEFLVRTSSNQYVDVFRKDKELVMRVQSDKIFQRETVELKEQKLWILDGLFSIVSGLPNNIVVSSSVDFSFIPSKKYMTKFDLSMARSISLCEYFIANWDIKPKRLGISEYGKFYDVSPPDDIIEDNWDFIKIVLLNAYE